MPAVVGCFGTAVPEWVMTLPDQPLIVAYPVPESNRQILSGGASPRNTGVDGRVGVTRIWARPIFGSGIFQPP